MSTSPSPRSYAGSIVAALVCTVLAVVALVTSGTLPALLLMLVALAGLAAPVIAEQRSRDLVE